MIAYLQCERLTTKSFFMFTNSSWPTFLGVVVIVVALYYLLVAFLLRKTTAPLLSTKITPSIVPVSETSMSSLPQLIDKPTDDFSQDFELSFEKGPASETNMALMDDDESVLLKAAEIVVEKVQDIVNHIASNPPNPEEVTTKIRSVVNQYALFQNTEYYDAINSFIAVTVERDCSIQLSKQELMALWN